MITVAVNGAEVPPQNESEITQAVNRRRDDGMPTCVQVRVKEGDVDVVLRTPQCGSNGGGGGRSPTAKEQRIFDLWERLGLQRDGFAGGHVIAFLKQLRSLI